MMLSDRPEVSQSKKVALEDLLKVKRAERPEPDFWVRFEEDLHTKQLAAIVAKRPWWHVSLSHVPAGLARLRIPLGATAILALSFLTYREYLGPSDAPSAVPAPDLAASSSEDVTPENFEIKPVTASSVDATVAVAAVAASEPVADATVSTSDTRSHSATPTMIPWVGDAALVATANENRPAGSVITTNLVATQSAKSDIDEMLSLVGRTLTSTLAVRSNPVEPLTQVASQVTSRRDWLATYVTAMERTDNSRKNVDGFRERVTGRLNEDQLYNKFDRLGVAGGGLNVSF